jgi:hypothetical protein
MDSEPITIRALVHHIEHLVLYSLIWWQVVLGVWLTLRWVNKNWKIKKTFSVTSPTESKTQTVQPVINIDGSSISESVVQKKKNMGPVEVDIKKHIKVDSIDGGKMKMDETIKGKVKTQKDKLRKLRGK